MFTLYKDLKNNQEVTDNTIIENKVYFLAIDSPEENKIIEFLTKSKLSPHISWFKGNKTAELKIKNYIGQIRIFDKQFDVRSNKFSPELTGKKQLELIISDLDTLTTKISFSYESSAFTSRAVNWLEIENDNINKLLYLYQVFFAAPKEKQVNTQFQKIKQNPSLAQATSTKNDFIWNMRSITPSILMALNKKGLLSNKADVCSNVMQNPKIELPINHQTLNSIENRFIKFFFQYTEQISLKIISSKSNLSEEIKNKANELLRHARMYLQDTFFTDVTNINSLNTNSTVLSSRDGYRDIYSIYVTSLFSVKHIYQEFTDDLTIDLKKISTLYEIWCFYLISYHILGNAITISSSQSFIENGEIKNSTTFKNDRFAVSYNKTYSNPNKGSYSTALRPDISVTDIETKKIYHFDAKYRTESLLTSDDNLIKKYKNDDIYKMHTYLDAIYNSESSIVMYPGNIFCFFERAKPSKIINDVCSDFRLKGVGAIPAVPGRGNEKLISFIKVFFGEINH
jgi:hypothetical protein